MTTATISAPIEWQGTRILKLERLTPAAPAPRKPSAQPSRRERLLAGMKQIQDPTLRAAFRRRWWRELI
jgi:hypothetical protein